MNTSTTRRQFLGLCGAAALAAIPVLTLAQTTATLDVNDTMAKALGYVVNAKKVDAKKESAFKPGSHCGNCALYAKAQEKSGHAPCGAVGGKLVAATGWCRAYAA